MRLFINGEKCILKFGNWLIPVNTKTFPFSVFPMIKDNTRFT